MTLPQLPARLLAQDFGFPDPRETALDADGLLAVGGDLHPSRLLAAYANGIFPWFNSDADNILWWCPDPRGVLDPKTFTPRRSLKKVLRQKPYDIRFDSAFPAVIAACAATPRHGQGGTWITPNMREAYTELFDAGFAHSVEAWQDNQLVGGLYGVSLGSLFFGESMFTHARDASKCAFAALCEALGRWNFDLLDCQMMNDHLATLGVHEMSRAQFLQRLAENDLTATRQGSWSAPGTTAVVGADTNCETAAHG